MGLLFSHGTEYSATPAGKIESDSLYHLQVFYRDYMDENLKYSGLDFSRQVVNFKPKGLQQNIIDVPF